MEKTERLFNLIALLLDTRRPLTVSEIRSKIPGYDDQSDETFHRMFERDKADIRDLGFAIEQEDTDVWGDVGYRISGREALLGDLQLTAAEMTALSLAAQAWSGTPEGTRAFLKLSVGSGLPGDGAAWLLPRVRLDEIAALIDAIARRKRVEFDYRTGGAGAPQRRRVDPYALSHRNGWYLTGFDHDRGEVRLFKLSRVAGAIRAGQGKGPDFEAPAPGAVQVRLGPWEGEQSLEALVAVAPDVAWWVERSTGARRAGERQNGWIEFRIRVADLEWFAGWVAGFGDQALALEPAALREAVVAHLRATAGEGV